MGLDSVELVMAVEERFQIAITDEDAARLSTPGSLVAHVHARLGGSTSPPCLEQRAFYRLRRSSTRVFELPRSAIRPDTRWDDVLPQGSRRQRWRLLRAAMATPEWPSLTFLANVPDAIATVGATARMLASNCPAAFKAPGEGWSRAEVQDVVRELLRVQLGITDFEWDDEFVADLGVE